MSDKQLSLFRPGPYGAVPNEAVQPGVNDAPRDPQTLDVYRRYRAALIQAKDAIESANADFTADDFTFSDEQWQSVCIEHVRELLDEALAIRGEYLDGRYTLTEGGGA